MYHLFEEYYPKVARIVIHLPNHPYDIFTRKNN